MDYPDMKPCPFCGKDPVMRRTMELYPSDPGKDNAGEVETSLSIECSECHAQQHGEYLDEVLNLWNQRKGSTDHLNLLREFLARAGGYLEGKSDDDDAFLDEVRAAVKPEEEIEA